MHMKKVGLAFLLSLAVSTSFGQKPVKPALGKASPEEQQILSYIKGNDFDGIRSFLAEKVDAPVKKGRKESAVLLTAEFGTTEMMRLLVNDLDLDVNIKALGNQTPVHRAAQAGNTAMLQFLIEEKRLNPDAKAGIGYTPLFLVAASDKNMDAIRYLVEKAHANVSIRDRDGNTPLSKAASHRCLEVFRYLVEEAHADYKDDVVMAEAKKPGNTAILNFINQKTNGVEADNNNPYTRKETDPTVALFDAIKTGNVDALKKLADETTLSFNKARTANDYSALQYAIECGQLPVVRYLFENHQPDKIFAWGSHKPNALHWAAVRGKTEIARYLIEERGFNPNENDNRGSDAFCYAISAKINNTETIDFFIKNYRADIEQKDEFGQTSLMRAISYGNLTTVKYLIEKAGANTSASSRNSFGENIYQIAANIYSGPDILKYLVTTLKPDPEQVLGRASIEKATALATKEYLRTLFK